MEIVWLGRTPHVGQGPCPDLHSTRIEEQP
jgi:hypothetical protein